MEACKPPLGVASNARGRFFNSTLHLISAARRWPGPLVLVCVVLSVPWRKRRLPAAPLLPPRGTWAHPGRPRFQVVGVSYPQCPFRAQGGVLPSGMDQWAIPAAGGYGGCFSSLDGEHLSLRPAR